MSTFQEKETILHYWRAIELFLPQQIPAVMPHKLSDPVFFVTESMPLPWEASHFLKSKPLPPKMTRRHQLYCGVYDIKKVRDILEEKFGKDPESLDGRSDNQTCLFSFCVTDSGRPILDTLVIATCAWAIGRTLDPGPENPDWLNRFEHHSEKIALAFAERLAIFQDDEEGQALKKKDIAIGRPISHAEILQEVSLIAKELGVADFMDTCESRIKTSTIPLQKEYQTTDQDFLNSFFVADLKKIAKHIQQQDMGKALSCFLMSDATLDCGNRIDVPKCSLRLSQQLHPHLFPSGRWPSQGHHPLVFSQQFAINAITDDLMENAGLFAINGPPGTGKTTLLRDLIAAVITERAKHLSHLSQPDAAFAGEKKWKTGEYTRVVSVWKKQFKGFGMVVSSSNNGAVENVTLEIPAENAIDPSWLEEVDYFSDIGSSLIKQNAWAMMAARLGNKSNRTEFISQFWYGIKNDAQNFEDKKNIEDENLSFLALLKNATTEAVDWKEAVAKFKNALAEEHVLREERIQAVTLLAETFFLELGIQTLQVEAQDLTNQEIKYTTHAQKVLLLKQKLTEELTELNHHRLAHRKFFPSFMEIIFSFGKSFREWRHKDKLYISQIDACEEKIKKASTDYLETNKSIASTEKASKKIKKNIAKEQASLSDKKTQLEMYKNQLGDYFPCMHSWEENESARELSSPWSDPKWNEARAKVFLAALHLHKAFIYANADKMRKSLQGAMDILSGAAQGVSQSAAEEAWTALFFVVPIISTTFASFDRLFSHLGKESLGWLLIDEAGQATPQAAVGAIWRSKRVVVVGDPLQLEPILPLPFTAQQALRTHYHLSETWLPGSTSTQKLADRVSALGTYLHMFDTPMWVGSPLRVHRRCDNPMFDISNQIAYDSFMVFGTATREALIYANSAWINITSDEASGHWIPQEGEAVKILLQKLIEQGVVLKNVFLISPFRDVVSALFQIAKQFPGTRAGTVHTMQGKEAEIIILVLGGNPQKVGAKQWASAKPNLLNVAVSRAKRRLYVVGDRHAWSQYRYFNTLAKLLPEEKFLSRLVAECTT